MRDAGMSDAQIKGSHTRRDFLASLSSPTRNFHARFRSFINSTSAQKIHAEIRTVLQSKKMKTRKSAAWAQNQSIFNSGWCILSGLR